MSDNNRRSLAPGDHLSLTSEPIGRMQLALYSEASGDHNPMHLDALVAKKAGFDDVIVHGMLSMAIMGRMLTDVVGPASIRRYRVKFSGVVPVDAQLICRAEVKAPETYGMSGALLECSAELTDGTKVLIGSAELCVGT